MVRPMEMSLESRGDPFPSFEIRVARRRDRFLERIRERGITNRPFRKPDQNIIQSVFYTRVRRTGTGKTHAVELYDVFVIR